MPVPLQLARIDVDIAAGAGNHSRPGDSAVVQDVQRMLIHSPAKQSRPRIHAEHMETVIGGGLTGEAVGQMRPVLAGKWSDNSEQPARELTGIQLGRDTASQPIRFD